MKRRVLAPPARGFSLIELMVGVTIALVVTLVIFSVLTLSESRKRTSTSVNDINQSGAYGMYLLDKAVRSAGSGFTSARRDSTGVRRFRDAFGCTVNARRVGVPGEVLPRTVAFPAPFAAVGGTMRLAPVVIGQGQSAAGSDVLIVMAGTAGFGEAASIGTPQGTVPPTDRVQVGSTIGYRSGDVVLIGAPTLFTNNSTPCLVSQVSADPTGSEVLLGNAAGASAAFYSAAGAGTSLGVLLDDEVYVAAIGNVNPIGGVAGNPAQNPPLLRMYGVGANQTLFGYDPLRVDGTDVPVPIVEGVVEMRALYGLDTNDDGVFDSWQAPTGATWGAAALLNGTAASTTNLRRIVSVRLALVLRTSLIEQTDASGQQVTAATLPQQLFADLGAPFATAYTVPDRNFRYRVVESTIPVRNALMPQ